MATASNKPKKSKHSRPQKKVAALQTSGRSSGKANNLTKLYQKMPLDSMIGKASRKDKAKSGMFTRRGD